MAARPRIGIPLCSDDRGRWRRGRRYQYIHAAYACAIEAAGGLPLYLPVQRHPRDLLAHVEGLLVPGGDDLPAPPGRPQPPEYDPVPAFQLDFDRALLEAALAVERPILAICYGMQLLCASLGGEPYYDLESELASHTPHWRARTDDPEPSHALEIEPESLLETLFASPAGPSPARRAVNSLHRQGIRDAGPHLRVTARAPDGLIEAVEHREHGFCVGVQWHPELLGDAPSRALFEAFVARAARHAPASPA